MNHFITIVVYLKIVPYELIGCHFVQEAMIKLINEYADSFARRLEMYYKKRPEIMQLGQEIEPHNLDMSTFFS